MTKINTSLEIINYNLNCMYVSEENNSFLSKLHTNLNFHGTKLVALLDSIDILTQHKADIVDFKSITKNMFLIFKMIITALISHFDSNDLYKIKNINDDILRQYYNLIEIYFTGFFTGYSVGKVEEYLNKNPFVIS